MPPEMIRPDLLVTVEGQEVDWTEWDQGFAGTDAEGDHYGWTKRDGIETLISDLSCMFYGGTRDREESYKAAFGFSENTLQRAKTPGRYLCEVLKEHLKDDTLTERDTYAFIFGAECNFYTTKNPLWAWLMLDVYLQAGLPPPAWVWMYLATAAHSAANIIGDELKNSHRTKYSSAPRKMDADLFSKLTLGMTRGSGDVVKSYVKDVEGFRLALRVRNLIRRDLSETAPINEKLLAHACGRIARETGWKYRDIRRAFSNWFIHPFHRGYEKTTDLRSRIGHPISHIR